jgi:hypothetical protein
MGSIRSTGILYSGKENKWLSKIQGKDGVLIFTKYGLIGTSQGGD